MQPKTYTAEDALPRIQSEQFRALLRKCLEYLKQKLTKVELRGANRTFTYYTCQTHDKRDPNWKPFKNLEVFCKREKTYMPRFLAVIEDAIGRTFDCECELLNDRREVSRIRLAVSFGVDFGQNGHRDCDVI